jgi:hypothetical protein
VAKDWDGENPKQRQRHSRLKLLLAQSRGDREVREGALTAKNTAATSQNASYHTVLFQAFLQ